MEAVTQERTMSVAEERVVAATREALESGGDESDAWVLSSSATAETSVAQQDAQEHSSVNRPSGNSSGVNGVGAPGEFTPARQSRTSEGVKGPKGAMERDQADFEASLVLPTSRVAGWRTGALAPAQSDPPPPSETGRPLSIDPDCSEPVHPHRSDSPTVVGVYGNQIKRKSIVSFLIDTSTGANPAERARHLQAEVSDLRVVLARMRRDLELTELDVKGLEQASKDAILKELQLGRERAARAAGEANLGTRSVAPGSLEETYRRIQEKEESNQLLDLNNAQLEEQLQAILAATVREQEALQIKIQARRSETTYLQLLRDKITAEERSHNALLGMQEFLNAGEQEYAANKSRIAVLREQLLRLGLDRPRSRAVSGVSDGGAAPSMNRRKWELRVTERSRDSLGDAEPAAVPGGSSSGREEASSPAAVTVVQSEAPSASPAALLLPSCAYPSAGDTYDDGPDPLEMVQDEVVIPSGLYATVCSLMEDNYVAPHRRAEGLRSNKLDCGDAGRSDVVAEGRGAIRVRAKQLGVEVLSIGASSGSRGNATGAEDSDASPGTAVRVRGQRHYVDRLLQQELKVAISRASIRNSVEAEVAIKAAAVALGK